MALAEAGAFFRPLQGEEFGGDDFGLLVKSLVQ